MFYGREVDSLLASLLLLFWGCVLLVPFGIWKVSELLYALYAWWKG